MVLSAIRSLQKMTRKQKSWFWTDYGALESQLQHKIEKMIVVADRAQDPMERPKGGQISLDNIPNNHLQYALTWFMMAANKFYSVVYLSFKT